MKQKWYCDYPNVVSKTTFGQLYRFSDNLLVRRLSLLVPLLTTLCFTIPWFDRQLFSLISIVLYRKLRTSECVGIISYTVSFISHLILNLQLGYHIFLLFPELLS